MGNIQAVIDLPEQLYLSLSGFGLTKESIANESRKLLALKYFKEKVLSLWGELLNSRAFQNGIL
jgi:hypothetical protein